MLRPIFTGWVVSICKTVIPKFQVSTTKKILKKLSRKLDGFYQSLSLYEWDGQDDVSSYLSLLSATCRNYVVCACFGCNWHNYNHTSGFLKIEFCALYIALWFALRSCRGSFYFFIPLARLHNKISAHSEVILLVD